MYIILSLTHFYIAENGFIADCSFVRAVRAHYPSTVFGAFILMTTRLAAVFTELGGGVGGGLSVRQTNAHQERLTLTQQHRQQLHRTRLLCSGALVLDALLPVSARTFNF